MNIFGNLFKSSQDKSEGDLFEKIKKYGFSFTPSNYEIWMAGRCIKSGSVYGDIVAEVMKSEITKKTIFQISFSDEELRNDIALLNEFDIFFKSSGRYMMATIPSNKTNNDCIGLSSLRLMKGATRNQKLFALNEPFGCSIFIAGEKLSKVSFAFNDPEKLIEFT
jgi:hypothetical protein